jgi:hypothetical protein
MILKRTLFPALVCLLACGIPSLSAQISHNAHTFTSLDEGKAATHVVLIDGDYLVHTIYSTSPNSFKKTLGGYYRIQDDALHVDLEFNSNFGKDSITALKLPFAVKENVLSLDFGKGPVPMISLENDPQELDGKWLMAGRVTEEGENRRDTTGPRKTMKFLINGHFQWIAFNTATMEFFGTGGGKFTSLDGKYVELIHFFSRDSTRVGQELQFTYTLKGDDWYHNGKSSQGKPLHEIWTRRK